MTWQQAFKLPPPAGIVAPCVNIVDFNTNTIDYVGNLSLSGYYIDSYRYYRNDPQPVLNTSTNKIEFSTNGRIWDISIKNSSGVEVMFLPCQEGLGNDNGNRSVHNQYADNYTDHFLLSTTGLWTNVIRQDTYVDGYSLKSNISGLLDEKVTNGTFDTDVSGWIPNTVDQSFTTFTYNAGRGRLSVSSDINPTVVNQALAYQNTGSHYEILRHIFTFNAYSIFTDNPDLYVYVTEGSRAITIRPNTPSNSIFSVIRDVSAINPSGFFEVKSYLGGNDVYINLGEGLFTSKYIEFDNISLKVYEDNIKIPVSLNNSANDCLGNVKTELPDLIAYYPFNGNANDESGNGYNGTVSGATLTTNRFGIANTAYEFDGISNRIYRTALPHSNNNFSISVWFKSESLITSNEIIGQYDAVIDKGFGIRHSVDGHVYAFGRNNTATYNSIGSINTIPLNRWVHLVVIYKTNEILLYINSIYQGHHAVLPGNWYNNINFQIGSINIPTPDYFKGLIADVRIYNKVLSNAEIKALYRELPR